MIDLWFLDQSGFAPTLPTGYGWGRRVTVVGALVPYDPTGSRFLFATRRKTEGRYDATAHLAFVDRVARAGVPARPCVIVLDNYSVHHRQPVKQAPPDLAARAVSFTFLPPSSPELNPIKVQWRHLKHQDIPDRSHPTDVALQAAVERALTNRARMLRGATHDLPRPA